MDTKSRLGDVGFSAQEERNIVMDVQEMKMQLYHQHIRIEELTKKYQKLKEKVKAAKKGSKKSK